MDIKGHIVQSLAGHDKGHVFVVLDVQNEFLYLSDGKTRKAEKPKRKKRKHTKKILGIVSPLQERILQGEKVLNSEIRKTLSQYAEKAIGEDQA